jgi:hypothetical protein
MTTATNGHQHNGNGRSFAGIRGKLRLDPDTVQAIAGARGRGLTVPIVCAAFNVSRSTVARAMRKAREAEQAAGAAHG